MKRDQYLLEGRVAQQSQRRTQVALHSLADLRHFVRLARLLHRRQVCLEPRHERVTHTAA